VLPRSTIHVAQIRFYQLIYNFLCHQKFSECHLTILYRIICIDVRVRVDKIPKSRSKQWSKYDKQDQQGKAAFNERNPTRSSNKRQWQGAQEDPKQKQDRAQGRAWAD
jgi:hypothetical protein